MKAFHNIFKHFSSNHQDKHSDKVNSHQHHGKVDKNIDQTQFKLIC